MKGRLCISYDLFKRATDGYATVSPFSGNEYIDTM